MLRTAMKRLGLAVLGSCLAVAAVAVTLLNQPERAVYVTWEGIGPDKWASVWLLRRHIDPEAEIRFVPVNADLSEATETAFDIPGSDYMRAGPLTTFEALLHSDLAGDKATDPTLTRIAEIINEMEVSRWTIRSTSVC